MSNAKKQAGKLNSCDRFSTGPQIAKICDSLLGMMPVGAGFKSLLPTLAQFQLLRHKEDELNTKAIPLDGRTISLAATLAQWRRLASALLYCVAASSLVGQQCKTVSTSYRKGIVHIRAAKTQKTGAVVITEGTAFIVSTEGYAITNAHVVSRDTDTDTLQITGATGSKNGFHMPVLLISLDEQHDLALLQLENTSETYQALITGEPWKVSPGAPLCSMGFPTGQEFHYSNGTLGGKAAANGWWSTDMPSNHGESGAPVFDDATGTVIAIKVGGYDDLQNLNLVIPINLAGVLLAQVPHLISLPSSTPPAPAASPSSVLPSGNTTVYNGFRFYGQSTFKFSTGVIGPWGSQEADIGVANPSGDKGLAQLFLANDAPPYTDPASGTHSVENSGIREMTTSNLDEVLNCPASDYKIHYFNPVQGNVYCVRTRDGRHWAKVKITIVAPDRVSFDYVYQPSGSRTFQ